MNDRFSPSVRIALCNEDDLETLVSQAGSPHVAAHHQERFTLQQARAAHYLLAWREGRNVGRATLYVESKYELVRRLRPRTAEVNALTAEPQGEGIGTALLRAAEEIAREYGHPAVGLAVEPSNPRARRLYARLGYRAWEHGQVVDEWTERHADHQVEHRDLCDYLIKTLPRSPAPG